MSKEAAMALITGQPVNNVNHSLITGDMNREVNPELSPGLVPAEPDGVKQVLDSDRFAMIAKKEAKLVREREEWKQQLAKEKAEVEELKAKLADPYKKIQSFEELRAKGQGMEALRAVGFSDTDIFNMLAEQAAPEKVPTVEELAEKAADRKIGAYKEEQAKLAADAQKAREQGLVTEYSGKISSTIKANPEKYEYSNYYGKLAEEIAIELATENVKVNGELLSPEQVADMVEEYYEEQDKAMSTFKKRQPKMEESVQGARQEPVKTRTVVPPIGQVATPASKTLTNKAAATVASTISRRETHDQKRDRLMNALKTGTYVPPKK